MPAFLSLRLKVPNLVLLGLICGVLSSIQAEVMIHEIMYHPTSEEFEPEPIEREFIELYNHGDSSVSLRDWAFVRGVRTTLPDITLPPSGYAVVAADPEAFVTFYGDPDVPVMGPWEGKLSNSGETLELKDAFGNTVDSLHYYDEGDWAARRRQWVERFVGWEWEAAHDGEGHSLELRSPDTRNDIGQNWGSSLEVKGTAGQRNGLTVESIPPLIFGVRHEPPVPTSEDAVTIQATIEHPSFDSLGVELHYRISNPGGGDYAVLPMLDDGNSNDGRSGDRIYGVELPPFPAKTIIEFNIQVRVGEHFRIWPVVLDFDDQQIGFAMFQFDDEPAHPSQATYRAIVPLSQITRFSQGVINTSSNAQMNATFIAQSGGRTEVRYQCGIRLRGNSSREEMPRTFRINLPSDQPWKGLTSLNLNSQFSYLQALGLQLVKAARLPAPDARSVQFRLNGANNARVDSNIGYGSYVHVDPLNEEFLEKEFPDDADGNLYKKESADPNRQHKRWGVHSGQVIYNTPDWYRTDQWTKQSNASEEDWSDLQSFVEAMHQTLPQNYVEEISPHVNVEQWVRWFALLNLINHHETNLSNGIDDDYSMYRGVADPRFVLLPHDMDTIFGLGDTSTSYDATIYQMVSESFGGLDSSIPQLATFINVPSIHIAYLNAIEDLLNGILHPDQFDLFVDSVIGHVPSQTRNSIKNFMATRRSHVLREIESKFQVHADLETRHGYGYAPWSEHHMSGGIDMLRMHTVRVQGVDVTYHPGSDDWLTDFPLFPGINRVLIEGVNEAGEVIEAIERDVWSDVQPSTDLVSSIESDRVLTAEEGPYLISGTVVVNAGVELKVEAGTTLFFKPNARLLVEGSLLAEGERYARIRFTSEPTLELEPSLPGLPPETSKWGGIHFRNSTGSVLSYVDIEHAQDDDGSVGVIDGHISLDHVSFDHTHLHCIVLERSTLIADSCRFPRIFADGGDPGALDLHERSDHIRSLEYPTQGEIVIQDCMFGSLRGRNAAVRLDGAANDVTSVVIRDSEFRSNEWAHLNLDTVNAVVIGNKFADTKGTDTNLARSIELSGGKCWVVGNVFSKMDHALLLSGDVEALIENNSFYQLNPAREAISPSVIHVESGDHAEGGLYLSNNIFALTHTLTSGIDSQADLGRLQIDTNLFPSALADAVIGDISLGELATNSYFSDENPFTGLANGDFNLWPDAATRFLGSQGRALGDSADIRVFIEPSNALLTSDSIEFEIGGPGIVAFQYRQSNGDWSDALPINDTFDVSGTNRHEVLRLSVGEHSIEVRGQDAGGRWQNGEPTRYTWTSAPTSGAIRLNEVLASNTSIEDESGNFPDLIEIYNSGPVAISLRGYSLSDDPANPLRYSFPIDDEMSAGEHRVLQMGLDDVSFGLNKNGETLALYLDGEVVDELTFGPQITDYSLARAANGEWELGVPTFGAANILALTGNAAGIRINEWYAADGFRFSAEFIELHNPIALPVKLDGFTLTDDPRNRPGRFAFSENSFAPANGFVLLSPDPEGLPMGAAKIGFRLDAGFETLTLERESSEVDRIFLESENLFNSSGRTPDGGNEITRMKVPTPGASNHRDEEIAPPMHALIDHLRITELMFNPEGDGEAEWIELTNTGPESLSLGGVRFVEGIEFTFQELTIDPGERILIVANQSAFESRYEGGHRVVGSYTGRLSNQGETLALALPEPYEAAIVRVRYEPEWLTASDGGGASLILRHPDQMANLSGSLGDWRMGYIDGGSPGSDEMTLTSSRLVEGTIGINLTYQISTSYPATRFEVSGLPMGVSYDSVTGVISGTPGEAGTFRVSITAKGEVGGVVSSIIIEIGGWGELHHFEWETIPSPQNDDEVFTVSATARDLNGRLVESYNGEPQIWARMQLRDRQDVVITEVSDQYPRFIEIRNLWDEPVHTDGWVVYLNDASIGIKGVHGVNESPGRVWAFPPQMHGNQTILLSEADGSLDFEVNWDFGPGDSGRKGWAAIGMETRFFDCVFWGYTEDEIHSLNSDYEVSHSWFFESVIHEATPGKSLQRVGDVDTDRSEGWIWQSPSPKAVNKGMVLRMIQEETIETRIWNRGFEDGVWTSDISIQGASDSVRLIVWDIDGLFSSSNRFVIDVRRPPILVSNSQVIVAEGHEFNYQIVVNYEVLSYAFTEISPELTMDLETGRITSAPLEPGLYSVGLLIETVEGTISQGLGIEVRGDSDGDGIPDATENAMNMDWNDPTDAHIDHDNDGQTTLNEFLAWTGHLDPRARLTILSMEWTTQKDLMIRWRSAGGKWYRFWMGTPVSHGIEWERLRIDYIRADDIESSVLVPKALIGDETKRFFRIEALLHGGEP